MESSSRPASLESLRSELAAMDRTEDELGEMLKPWPIFLTVFRDEPEVAGEAARHLFSTDSLYYIPFMLSFPWEEDVQKLPEALHSSEFLIALLDIASDELWYTQMKKFAIREDLVMQTYVAMKINLTLKCICRLMPVYMNQAGEVHRPQSAEMCEQCMERFPSLWGRIWRDRDIILHRGSVGLGADGQNFESVWTLLGCHFLMFRQFRQGVPPLSSHFAHIAFLFWSRLDQQRWITHTSFYVIAEVLTFMGPPEVIPFMEEVVPVVIAVQDPVQFFHDVLLRGERDMIEPSNVYHHLLIMLFVLRWCKSDIVVTDEGRRNALFVLVRVFQRYKCHGNMTGTPADEQRIAEMILKCFHFFQVRDYGAVIKDIFLHPYDLDFVQVVAAVLVPAYTHLSDFILRGTIRFLLLQFEKFGQYTRNEVDPGPARVYAHLRRILQAHWLPVLQEIRAAIQSPERKDDEDPKAAGQLREVEKMWERLGPLYRLDKRSQESDSVESLIGYIPPAERLQGCFLRECPCYGRRAPWHKTRRVCKGCWVAFYCGERCQKRDWKLGHRNVCLGRH